MAFRGLIIGTLIAIPLWAGLAWVAVKLGHPTSVWLYCDMLGMCN